MILDIFYTVCKNGSPVISPRLPSSLPPSLPPSLLPVSALECFCNRTDGELLPPDCLISTSPLVLKNCTTNFMCFKERFLSTQLGKIRTYWGCHNTAHDLPPNHAVNRFCSQVKDTLVVKCCNTSDACNIDLEIQLPIEGPTNNTGMPQCKYVCISVCMCVC